MAQDDQDMRDRFTNMSREELADYVGTDDASLSREELITLAQAMDTGNEQKGM